MSAFIIADDTIDLLVTAGVWGGGHLPRIAVSQAGAMVYFNKHDDVDFLGFVLKVANYDSVNYRYQESTACGAYHYSGEGIVPYLGGPVISWGQVLQAIRCYEYQSCESPTWGESLAKAVCDAIRRKVCGIIADEAGAEWDWSRSHAEEIRNTIRVGVES